jgi:hypothetical protein
MTTLERVYDRVLNMAQMHQIGVLHRGPNMLWTCRWNEAGRESSMCYELVHNQYDNSLKLRFRYKVLPDSLHRQESNLDYFVSLRITRSYKGKKWFWFVCPLVINGKACKRRVRNLYLLPNSDYFGCKHCRDLMARSLNPEERLLFRQTRVITPQEARQPESSAGFVPELNLGWRPAEGREICQRCGCLSEGAYCCNCGALIEGSEQQDFFNILGVPHTASPQDIRVAFTSRLKEYHPDRVAHLGSKIRDVAEREIKQINLAYEILKDPDRREAYLRGLGNRAAG